MRLKKVVPIEETRFYILPQCGRKLSIYNAGVKCFCHEESFDLKPLLPTVCSSYGVTGFLKVEGDYQGWW